MVLAGSSSSALNNNFIAFRVLMLKMAGLGYYARKDRTNETCHCSFVCPFSKPRQIMDTSIFPRRIRLSYLKPLATGTHRVVYDMGHGLVIKVMLSSTPAPEKLLKRLKFRIRRLSRYGEHRFLFREYNQYIRVQLSAQQHAGVLPVAEVRGLIQTDLGLGMIAEKLTAAEGSLAPQVYQLYKSGKLDALLPLLDDFANCPYEWDVVANDINAGNIVLADRDGVQQFVLVDGLGDSHFIPVRSWFSRFNRRSLDKRFDRMARFCGLEWDRKNRRFRQPRQG